MPTLKIILFLFLAAIAKNFDQIGAIFVVFQRGQDLEINPDQPSTYFLWIFHTLDVRQSEGLIEFLV